MNRVDIAAKVELTPEVVGEVRRSTVLPPSSQSAIRVTKMVAVHMDRIRQASFF